MYSYVFSPEEGKEAEYLQRRKFGRGKGVWLYGRRVVVVFRESFSYNLVCLNACILLLCTTNYHSSVSTNHSVPAFRHAFDLFLEHMTLDKFYVVWKKSSSLTVLFTRTPSGEPMALLSNSSVALRR